MTESRSLMEVVTGIEHKLDKLNNDLIEIKLERKLEQGSISAIKWVFGAVATCLSTVLIGIASALYGFYHSTVENDRRHTAVIQNHEARITGLEKAKNAMRQHY